MFVNQSIKKKDLYFDSQTLVQTKPKQMLIANVNHFNINFIFEYNLKYNFKYVERKLRP